MSTVYEFDLREVWLLNIAEQWFCIFNIKYIWILILGHHTSEHEHSVELGINTYFILFSNEQYGEKLNSSCFTTTETRTEKVKLFIQSGTALGQIILAKMPFIISASNNDFSWKYKTPHLLERSLFHCIILGLCFLKTL